MTTRLASCALLAVFLSQHTVNAGDPAKDPRGWRQLTFGMTVKEVVAALGTQVTRKPSQEELELLIARRHSPIVLEDIESMANAFLEDNPSSEDPAVKALRNARKTIAGARKSRMWGDSKGSGRASLEMIKPSDQNPALHLRGPRGALVLYRDSLNASSKKVFQSVLDATNTIRQFKDESQKKSAADNGENQDVTPSDLAFLPTTELGYQFSPELLFGPRFSGVVMTLLPAAEGENPFVAQDAYDLMVKDLEKTLGEPDNVSVDQAVKRTVWEFPETIVTFTIESRTADVPQYDSRQRMTVLRTVRSYPIKLSYEQQR
jgi:hypothetical protein